MKRSKKKEGICKGQSSLRGEPPSSASPSRVQSPIQMHFLFFSLAMFPFVFFVLADVYHRSRGVCGRQHKALCGAFCSRFTVILAVTLWITMRACVTACLELPHDCRSLSDIKERRSNVHTNRALYSHVLLYPSSRRKTNETRGSKAV